MQASGVLVVDTYIDAAIACFQRGLIARVAHAASAQQTTITFGKPEKKAASDTAIQRALAAVSQLSS